MTRSRKMFGFLMAMVIVVTSLFISATTVKAESVSVIKITGTGVSVRESASTNSTRLGFTSSPDFYKVEGSTTGGGYTWYKITYSGKPAWVAASNSWCEVITVNADPSFESSISAFPDSYKDKLRALHVLYPNWVFTAEPVDFTLDYAARQEELYLRKQVPEEEEYPLSLRTLAQGSYDWGTGTFIDTNGGWFGASREIIAYYMDPRNFLDSDVIMFMQQSFDPASQTITATDLAPYVQETFLENSYDGGNYVDDIIAAANETRVSPYVIVAKIIAEQGSKGTSSLISGAYPGFEGYYNFFNVKASGGTDEAVIVNGLTHAENQGWNSRRASIIGGAKFIAENYIAKGQDTFYYMDFNIKGDFNHQYAQSVRDAYLNTYSAKGAYLNNKNATLYFKIPVFKDMPSSVTPYPATSDALNNYYITGISLSGSVGTLSPSFDKFTRDYTLSVAGNATINLTLPAGASLSSATVSDSVLKLTVTGAAGFSDTYYISLNVATSCKLTVCVAGTVFTSITMDGSSVFTLGDPSGDGKISVSDIAVIQMHILGKRSLEGAFVSAADINLDGKLTVSDMVLIQKHILGIQLIS